MSTWGGALSNWGLGAAAPFARLQGRPWVETAAADPAAGASCPQLVGDVGDGGMTWARCSSGESEERKKETEGGGRLVQGTSTGERAPTSSPHFLEHLMKPTSLCTTPE